LKLSLHWLPQATYNKAFNRAHHMKPYTYTKAGDLAEAIAARCQPGTFVLAGGTDLIAQMKAGQRVPEHILDVKAVPELATVQVTSDGALEIGASVSATVLAGNNVVRRSHAGLHDGVQLIGSLQIQNRASLGGNICNAAPSADAVPALIVDGCVARIAGKNGEREILLEKLFAGPGKTNLSADEMLVSVKLAKPSSRSASAYLRFTPRREMDIAVVGAAARIELAEDGKTISGARVALASVAPTPVRAPTAEARLIGAPVSFQTFADAAIAAQSDASPISDTRASAEYRRELIAVLVQRALEQCAARLNLEVAA
jgi:carbon-monoxide dehydrogenase medium subunit